MQFNEVFLILLEMQCALVHINAERFLNKSSFFIMTSSICDRDKYRNLYHMYRYSLYSHINLRAQTKDIGCVKSLAQTGKFARCQFRELSYL